MPIEQAVETRPEVSTLEQQLRVEAREQARKQVVGLVSPVKTMVSVLTRWDDKVPMVVIKDHVVPTRDLFQALEDKMVTLLTEQIYKEGLENLSRCALGLEQLPLTLLGNHPS